MKPWCKTGLKSLWFSEPYLLISSVGAGLRGFMGSPGRFLWESSIFTILGGQIIFVLPIFLIVGLISYLRNKK